MTTSTAGVKMQQRMQHTSEYGIPTRQSADLAPGEVKVTGYQHGMPVVRHGGGGSDADLKIHQDLARQTGVEWNPLQRSTNALTGKKPEYQFGSKGYQFNHEAGKHQQMANTALTQANDLRQKGDIAGAQLLEQKAQQYRRQAQDYAALAQDPKFRDQKGENYIAANRPLTPQETARIQDNNAKFSSEINADPKLRQELNDVRNIADESLRAKRLAEIERKLSTARNNRNDLADLTQGEVDDLQNIPGGQDWLNKLSTRDGRGLMKEGLLALEMQRQGESIERIGRSVRRQGKNNSNEEATEVDIETAREIVQIKSGDYSGTDKLGKRDLQQMTNTTRYRDQRANGKHDFFDEDTGALLTPAKKDVVFHFFGKVSPELEKWLAKKGVVSRQGWHW
jgi:hypothetical protein